MNRINHKDTGIQITKEMLEPCTKEGSDRVFVELTSEIVRLINLPNSEWRVGQGEEIINHIKKQLEPQPIDIGRGMSFVGLAKTGEYCYQKTVNGKEVIYPVSPEVWEDTKLIFEDAIERERDPSYKIERIRKASSLSLTAIQNKKSLPQSPNA